MSTSDPLSGDIESLRESLTAEHVFAAGLVGLAAYMFVAAYDFPPAARLFPQAASGLVLAGAALRLLKGLLPYQLSRNDSVVLSGAEAEDPDSESNEDVTRMFVLGALIVGYIFAGYAIGLFWVTPVFAAAYLLYTGQKWWVTALITAILTGVAYVFVVLMNLDIVTGAI